MLWRKKRVVLSFMALGLFLSVLFSVLQRTVYRSRAVLEIQDLNENFLNIEGQDPTAASSGGSTSDSYIQTQINVLQSRALLVKVIQRMGLRPKPARPSLSSLWRKVPHGNGALADDSVFLDDVASHLTVRVMGETHDVEILFDSDDPHLAANFCNTLVAEFASRSREMRWDSTQAT